MEFIDGEDLASLLRRIGRLAQDKALEIARAAVRGPGRGARTGVLHRDLKPANVMIDEQRARAAHGLRPRRWRRACRGRLAGHAGLHGARAVSVSRRRVRRTSTRSASCSTRCSPASRRSPGTPSATSRGCTAKRAPTRITQLVSEIDPLADRIIQRCLAKDPAERPSSALQVACSAARRRPAGGRAGRGRNAVAGDGGGFRRPQGAEGAHAAAILAALVAGALLVVWLSARNAGRPLPAGDEAAGRARRSGQDDGARPGYRDTVHDAAWGFTHHRLHAAPAERPIGGTMGEPASWPATRRGVILVPAVAGRARVRQPAAIRPGDLQHPLAVAAGNGQRPRRSQGAAASAYSRRTCRGYATPRSQRDRSTGRSRSMRPGSMSRS